jgi:hypothetical protein
MTKTTQNTETSKTAKPSPSSKSEAVTRSRRGRKASKLLPDIALHPLLEISDKDQQKWIQQIELRGSKNELYRMADRFQANLVITGILTIKSIFQAVAHIVNERGGVFTVDDLNKLTTSFNRAMASVNQSLSYLGVTGKDREEQVDTDALAQALATYNLDDHIPPGLEEAYLSAQREETKSGSADLTEEQIKDRSDVVAILREPLKSYTEDEGEEPSEVVDVEKTGRIGTI